MLHCLNKVVAYHALVNGWVLIEVFEGKRILAEENRYLGRVLMRVPQGKMISHVVTFEVDTYGVLTVQLQDRETGEVVQEAFERCARVVPQKVIARLKEQAKTFKEADMQQIESQGARNNLLATCFVLKYKLFNDQGLAALKTEYMEGKCQAVEDWARAHSEESSEMFERKKRELLRDWQLHLEKQGLKDEGWS